MRTRYGRYAEYHTSLDNKDFIDFEAMIGSIDAYTAIVAALEANAVWRNTVQCGEPQLGRKGLYQSLGSQKSTNERDRAMFWLLNLADGTRDLLAIAKRSGQPLGLLISLASELSAVGLLEKVTR
jgi:aminopeptidase-like protein